MTHTNAAPQHTIARPLSHDSAVTWNEKKVFGDVDMRAELQVRVMGRTGLQEVVPLGLVNLPLTEVEDLGDLALAPGPRRFVLEVPVGGPAGEEGGEGVREVGRHQATVVLQLYWKLNPLSVLTLKVCVFWGVFGCLGGVWVLECAFGVGCVFVFCVEIHVGCCSVRFVWVLYTILLVTTHTYKTTTTHSYRCGLWSVKWTTDKNSLLV